jgi:hypothetical protein
MLIDDPLWQVLLIAKQLSFHAAFASLFVVVFVVFPASGQLVLCLLLLTSFELCFAAAMALKEGIKGLQPRSLLLPVCLAAGRLRLLLADSLELLVDGFVETLQEFLIVAPFRLSQPALHCLAKALAVVVAILFEHAKFALRVTFRGHQACQTLRRFVATILHEVQDRLQGEGFRHVELEDVGEVGEGGGFG